MKVKIALGVVAGYALAIFVLATLNSLAFKLLGPERVFRPGSWELSTTLNALGLIFWLLATIVGGLTAGVISKGELSPRILAALVFLIFVGPPIWEMTRPAGEVRPRPAIVDSQEAMRNAQRPPWANISISVLGVFGVLIGAAIYRRAEALRTTA